MSVVASFLGWLRPLVLALDVALLFAFVIEFVATPHPDRLASTRSVPERIGLTQPFVREIEVRLDPSQAGLRLELFEEVPSVLRNPQARAPHDEVTKREEPENRSDALAPEAATVDEEGCARFARRYVAVRRGRFAFGDVRLRVHGRLGLLALQGRLHGEQSFAVEPALANLKRTLALAASDRWQDLGVRLLRRRGGETEFESLRDYVVGDDVRRVDWKAFARRGRPIVRDYQVERGQEFLLLIDRGRRMRATSADPLHRGWTKLDWALDAALELAVVALAKGDRVGAAVFAGGLDRYVAPERGARQKVRLSQALFDWQPSHAEGDLGRALRELAARHPRRATVLVLSDVADPLALSAQREALAGASRRHRIVFAALDDPGLRSLRTEARVSAPERAAAFELADDRRRALARLRGSGARVVDALPAEAAGPCLAAWLDERRA